MHKKFDKDKPRIALVPPSLVTAVAEVLTFGAKKYGANNWRNATNNEQHISAALRHLYAWMNGEDNDPESGFHHLHHLACNVAFLVELKHLPLVRSNEEIQKQLEASYPLLSPSTTDNCIKDSGDLFKGYNCACQKCLNEHNKDKPTGCLWDSIPEADKGKPMGISCPCKKCTPHSL